LTAQYHHIPVLLEAVREHLNLQPGETFLDCTLGGAGHSLALAPSLIPNGHLIGIDQDATALSVASQRLQDSYPNLRFSPLAGNFSQLDNLLLQLQIPGINAVLFDLGVSSYHLDTPERGFSYIREAPLDMRMNPGKQTLTAAEIINNKNQTDLAWIIRTFGEERFATRIAAAIVRRRTTKPLQTTTELAEVIQAAIPAAGRRKGGNPAKRTFQAFRIAVNDELEALRTGLEAAIRWLQPDGRLVVISYHSLEDRIVKETFASLKQACICPPEQPICTCGLSPVLSKVSSKPVLPEEAEVKNNSRSGSAKLRWAVKASRRE
jgi:16S rRNA (cytosine1402-N4)-methyltransferase